MLTSPDYYTVPSLVNIGLNGNIDPDYASRIPNFVVGRSDYGWIEFLGETDIRQLDIEKIVKFDRYSVSVYENESEKPPVGHGLNKPAVVTLILNGKTTCLQGEQLEKFENKLKQCTERQGACFVSFHQLSGEWKFLVNHFSRFGLDEDEEEDIFMDDTDVEEQDKGIEDIPMDPEEVALSHSLPAHLGLDPAKMKEMKMIMFPFDEEDEESNRPHPPERRNFGAEPLRVDSPRSSAKPSSQRGAMQGSARKTVNKASPLCKSPQALLEYHDGEFNMSPPRNILMARQNPGLPLRKRVKGFKMEASHASPLGGHYSRNVVDAALFMGRSFRVGWGPNGTLVHSGSPVGSPENGLSSVITIERVAMDKCVRDEKNELKEDLIDLCFSAPLNLHKSLDHEYTEDEVDSGNLKLQKVVSSRFALSDICRDYIAITEKQLDVPGLSMPARLILMHQVMVWELIKVLFSQIVEHSRIAPDEIDEDGETMLLDKQDGSLDIDIEAKSLARRADFSVWLQESVCHRVQEEVSCMSDSNDLEHILILLTGKQLDAAVELAASRGDVRLAMLLSQSAGSTVNRNDMAQQLDLWRNNGMDFNFMEKDRLKVYELLAGNVLAAVSDLSVDWKRFLGLVMWYQLPPDASLPIIINTYQQLLAEERVPHPVPIYVDEGPLDDVMDRSAHDCYDLSYHLMLLHSDEDKPDTFLKTMFSAFSSTYDALDYHMIWHQRAILEAIGVFRSNDLHVLDMSFISQLLCLGQCHWAIYVAIHMPYREDFPFIQDTVIREILFQYCEIWSAEETQRRFIEDLGVPSQWMHEALATYFQYYGNLPKALDHFIECSSWQKAHSIFMTSVAHPLFLSAQDSEIWRLVCLMEDHKKEIANWSLGGGLFIDFYDLRSSMQEDQKSGKLGTLEHMTDACRGFFRRLNESLLVWGSKLPVNARATYSSMAEQLSKLLVSIPDGTMGAQMSCFDTVLSAPVTEDLRSGHLQNAVSLFAYYVSETENQRISEAMA